MAAARQPSEFARLAIELAAQHKPRWTRQGLTPRRRCSCGNPLPCRQLSLLPTDRSLDRTSGSPPPRRP